MASEDWSAAAALIAELSTESAGYAFSQAVRLLERALPDAPQVGHLGPASEEVLRFRGTPSFSFPRSDISSIEVERYRDDASRLSVAVTFMGLYGVASPLPSHYTESVLADDEPAERQRDFMDFLNHRLLSLFYRSQTKYRHYWQGDTITEQGFSRKLMAFIGIDDPDNLPAEVDWARILPFVGLLTLRGRTAQTICTVVSHYFDGIPCKLESFVPRQASIPIDQQNRLGLRNAELSASLSLGDSVADVTGKFRMHLGPLSFAEYKNFLPGTDHSRALRTLMNFLLRDPLSYDPVLWLNHEEIPSLCLGVSPPRDGDRDANSRQLGLTAWLGRRPSVDENQAIVFQDPYPS